MIVADRSLSTRCGIDGVPLAATIARAIATIGMSAVFFQDSIGLITFNENFSTLEGLRPRIGKGQVIQCLDAYQHGEGLQEIRAAGDLAATLAGFMRKTSLVPVVSDFLFEDVNSLFRDLEHVNSLHDIFIVLVEADYAFELPTVSAGWIEAFDVETGRSRVMSRRELRQMAPRVTGVAGRCGEASQGKRLRRAAVVPGSEPVRHRTSRMGRREATPSSLKGIRCDTYY